MAALLAALALGPPLLLNAGANGRTFTVAPRTTIELALPSNPSTGYRWTLVPLAGRSVRFVSHRYVPPAQPVPGRGGVERWRFVAASRGSATVRLVYARPWAPQAVARRFRVALRIP